MAIPNFSIAVVMTGPDTATQVGQASSYQFITPWGSSDQCVSFAECVSQLIGHKGGTPYTGRMGDFFQNGNMNGAAGRGISPPLSSNLWSATP